MSNKTPEPCWIGKTQGARKWHSLAEVQITGDGDLAHA